MAVKVRAVNACELGLAANGQTAAAAHAGTVNHDGVHGNDGLDAVRTGGLADKLHHNHRADGDYGIVLVARVDQLLEHLRNQCLAAVRAVIGHDVQVGAGVLHLVLEDDDVLAAETGDQVNLSAHFVQLLGLRICDRAAQTAADNSDLLEALKLARLAERTDKIMQAVALIQRAERHRRCADLLENDRDGTLFAVKICDRERNTLAFCADTQDDELTRLCLAGNVRGLDHHQLGVCVQRLLFQNLIHWSNILSPNRIGV